MTSISLSICNDLHSPWVVLESSVQVALTTATAKSARERWFPRRLQAWPRVSGRRSKTPLPSTILPPLTLSRSSDGFPLIARLTHFRTIISSLNICPCSLCTFRRPLRRLPFLQEHLDIGRIIDKSGAAIAKYSYNEPPSGLHVALCRLQSRC